MQGVPGGETVAVEGRHRALDAHQPDERSLAHQGTLEKFVQHETDRTDQQHVGRGAQTLRPAQPQRHHRHEGVPDHPVAEPTDATKKRTDPASMRRGVHEQA